jgi:hypothetical protein
MEYLAQGLLCIPRIAFESEIELSNIAQLGYEKRTVSQQAWVSVRHNPLSLPRFGHEFQTPTIVTAVPDSFVGTPIHEDSLYGNLNVISICYGRHLNIINIVCRQDLYTVIST